MPDSTPAPQARPVEQDVCRCEPYAYIGTQMAGEPVRCERCRGLVDEIAAERLPQARPVEQEIRETYAAMRARVPQHHTESAREEFDEWLAREREAAKAEALREYADLAASRERRMSAPRFKSTADGRERSVRGPVRHELRGLADRIGGGDA